MQRFYAVGYDNETVEDTGRIAFYAVDSVNDRAAHTTAVEMYQHSHYTCQPFTVDLYDNCQVCGETFATCDPRNRRDGGIGAVAGGTYGKFVGAVHARCRDAAEAQAEALYVALNY